MELDIFDKQYSSKKIEGNSVEVLTDDCTICHHQEKENSEKGSFIVTKIKIGSDYCCQCYNFVSIDRENKIVKCKEHKNTGKNRALVYETRESFYIDEETKMFGNAHIMAGILFQEEFVKYTKMVDEYAKKKALNNEVMDVYVNPTRVVALADACLYSIKKEIIQKKIKEISETIRHLELFGEDFYGQLSKLQMNKLSLIEKAKSINKSLQISIFIFDKHKEYLEKVKNV